MRITLRPRLQQLEYRAVVILAAGLVSVLPEWALIAYRYAPQGADALLGYGWRTTLLALVPLGVWTLIEGPLILAPHRAQELGLERAGRFLRSRPGWILSSGLLTGGVVTLSWALAVSLWKDLDLPAFVSVIPWEAEAKLLFAHLPTVVAASLSLGCVAGWAHWSLRSPGTEAPDRLAPPIRHLAPIGLSVGLVLSLVNTTRVLGFFSAFHAPVLALTFVAYVAGLTAVAWTHGMRLPRRVSQMALGTVLFGATAGVLLLASNLASPQPTSLQILDENRPLAAKVVVALFPAHRSPPSAPTCPAIEPPDADPVGAPEARPDILVFTVDALAADHIGAYGYPVDASPTIDHIATRGGVFMMALSNGASTQVGIPALHFSRPFECVATEAEGRRRASLFGELRTAGYRTEHYSAYPFAEGVTRAHAASLLGPFDAAQTLDGESDYPNTESTDSLVATAAADAIAASNPHQPLAFWVHFYNPHPVYNPPSETRGSLGTGQVARYDEEVLASDRAIARVLAAWERSRPDRPLLVAITGDHGQALTDFGRHGHNTTIAQSMVHVPLIFSGPGIEPRLIRDPVSTLDFAPTILDLVGLSSPPEFFGQSLAHQLAGRPQEERPVWLVLPTDDEGHLWSEAVVLGSYKLYREVRPKYGWLYSTDEYFRLYDIRADPQERVNLVEAYPDQVERLRSLLISNLAAKDEPITRRGRQP